MANKACTTCALTIAGSFFLGAFICNSMHTLVSVLPYPKAEAASLLFKLARRESSRIIVRKTDVECSFWGEGARWISICMVLAEGEREASRGPRAAAVSLGGRRGAVVLVSEEEESKSTFSLVLRVSVMSDRDVSEPTRTLSLPRNP